MRFTLTYISSRGHVTRKLRNLNRSSRARLDNEELSVFNDFNIDLKRPFNI